MLPDFPRLKERLLRLAWFEHHGRVQADELIGAIRAVPYFEGRGFATGDVEGHVERTDSEVMAFPYRFSEARSSNAASTPFARVLPRRPRFRFN